MINTSRVRRRALRFHHTYPIMLAGLAAVTLVLRLLDLDRGLFFYAFAVIAFAWMLARWIADRWHSEGFCQICFDQLPLDGPAEASRCSHWLTAHHSVRFRIAIFVSLVALDIWTRATDIVAICGVLAYVGDLRLEAVHWRLRPWCPHCADDDENGREPDVAPSTPVGTRTS